MIRVLLNNPSMDYNPLDYDIWKRDRWKIDQDCYYELHSQFFDSFDNDNKHNNPYILGMTNDGTLAYDHQKDGSTQQLAGCLRDFRNKPFPVKARITYYQNTLTVNIQK